MDTYSMIAIILSLAVLMSYINHRFFKFPITIAMMASAMILALIMILLHHTTWSPLSRATMELVKQTHFGDLLLRGMLSFLLFAGALSIDFDAMKKQKWEIGILASLSTVVSAALIAISAHWILHWMGFELQWIYACLFGALISPTDPIAVLATFKKLGAPAFLKASVAGESLFNDGVGIVIFTTLYEFVTQGKAPTTKYVTLLFLQQAAGGLVYGYVVGWLALWLCKSTKDDKLSLLITIAVVTGAYTLALAMNISGPLAMVVAGIVMGRGLRKTPQFPLLETIWESFDEILNTILFLLIGLVFLTIHPTTTMLFAALIAIPLVLLIRFLTVAGPIMLLPRRRRRRGMIPILTWGGLRGGLAIALALALPPGDQRHLILSLTYAIVAFSVIIQGLTVKNLVERYK